MKIAVLIPDRGDRPKLMSNCLRMMQAQTLKPHTTIIMSGRPESDKCDITYRYREGYELATKMWMYAFGYGIDVIAFVENDDWYAPDYLETMAREWDAHGRPEIFGTNYTIYYHLKLKRYFILEHYDRASAMNTFIKPGLRITWPVDEDPYTDMHLWQNCGLRGVTFRPGRHISIGMKHGEGMTGGGWHRDKLDRFKTEDGGLLRDNLDPASFEFYNNYFNGH